MDAFFFEQRLIERHFIDRFADAALGDNDHFGADNSRYLRIGQVEDGADPGMAGTFAQDEIFFPGDPIERVLNSGHQRVIVGRLEILAREIRLDRDWAHIHERTVELINAVHQQDVLIDLLFGNFDEALADWFDIADPGIMLLQSGDQAQGGGGLAIILACGSDEDARGGGVQVRKRS